MKIFALIAGVMISLTACSHHTPGAALPPCEDSQQTTPCDRDYDHNFAACRSVHDFDYCVDWSADQVAHGYLTIAPSDILHK